MKLDIKEIKKAFEDEGIIILKKDEATGIQNAVEFSGVLGDILLSLSRSTSNSLSVEGFKNEYSYSFSNLIAV